MIKLRFSLIGRIVAGLAVIIIVAFYLTRQSAPRTRISSGGY